MSWQREREIERRRMGEAARAERERQAEAERRERAKGDHLDGKPLPADRHVGNAPADRARRPRRPGDWSATRDRGYFL